MAKLTLTITEAPCPCGKPDHGNVPKIDVHYDPEESPSYGLSLLGKVMGELISQIGPQILQQVQEQVQGPANPQEVEWPSELSVL